MRDEIGNRFNITIIIMMTVIKHCNELQNVHHGVHGVFSHDRSNVASPVQSVITQRLYAHLKYTFKNVHLHCLNCLILFLFCILRLE